MVDIERWAVWTVVVHTLVVTIHAAAHGAVQVLPGAIDGTFVVVVFFATPVASAFLLRDRPAVARPAYFLTMLAGFAYGSLSHYVLPGPDNVASIVPEGWGLVFRGTTVALAVLEAVGSLLGALLLQRPRRSPTAAVGV